MGKVNQQSKNSTSSFLFHQMEYMDLCASTFANVKTFSSEIENQNVCIQFQINNMVAISPVRASFGGIVNCPVNLTGSLVEFFQDFEANLFHDGVGEIHIRTFPEVYHPHLAKIESVALEEQGYSPLVMDVTQYIQISSDPFRSKVKLSELQKLRRASSSMSFEQLSHDRLEDVYTLIEINREWKRYPMTTDFEWLLKLVKKFPRDYILFGVFDYEMVAAAVAVRVSSEILYTFYLGDIPRTRAVSPVVFLLEGIYNYALQNSYRLLDLGISTESGQKNLGLYNFKRNLGTSDSYRIIWSKSIS